jgi:peptide/nickel transport system substrate-binding protein
LAESWRLVNNFTWEFKLRQGLKFHNDEPLTAEAVRFSIERAQTLPGSLETFAQDVGLEKVEVVGEYTLHLTTRQPVANLPYHLAFLEILPPVYYADTDPNQVAAAPVGSGPYQVASTENGALVLDAVPSYWRGAPTLPRLIFKVMPEAEQRLAALAAGEASLVTDLPPAPADQWDVPNSRLEAIESTRRLFIGMRMGDGTPLVNKQVRQALNYGVNVEEIINNNLAGYGERYGSWVNPPANNPDLEPWPYDPDMARTLLAEAGYGEGITLTLRTPVDVYNQDVAIAQAVAAQLAEIDVTVEVDTIKNWDVYVRELLSGKSDPLFLLELNSRGDGLEDVLNMSQAFAFNPTGWRNESFEEATARAISTFNEDARDRLMDEAQAIAYEEAPWLWLWKPYDFYGVSQNLDWTPRRDGLINLYKPSTPPTESSN